MIKTQTRIRLLSIVAAAAVALAPALAEARAGGGGNSGSRGTRTNQSVPATRTAPEARPTERTPGTAASQPAAAMQRQTQAARPQAQQPSWFQRNPFLSGLVGGLVGAGLIGMLFGHGLFGADFGLASLFGLLLQFALIGGVVWLFLAVLRRRAPTYAMAGAGPLAREAGDTVRVHDTRPLDIGGGPARAGQDGVGLTARDFDAFERLLHDVQDAWSRGDVAALQARATPDMVAFFSNGLTADAQRGVANVVEGVKLEQGDLAEAWCEGSTDYATVAMRWSAVDYTMRRDNGDVVAGSRTARSEATEIWTFRREQGGPWRLSAVQQV